MNMDEISLSELTDITLLKSFETEKDPKDSSDEVYVKNTFENYDLINIIDNKDIIKSIDYSSIKFKCELNEENKMIERLSHKYFIYINCFTSIFAFHPSTDAYNIILCNDCIIPNKSLYCISKQYGIFYTNKECNKIYYSIINKNINKDQNGNYNLSNNDVLIFDINHQSINKTDINHTLKYRLIDEQFDTSNIEKS